MRNFYFTILMLLCIFSCHAQIIQVNDMKEITEYFNKANSKKLDITLEIDKSKCAVVICDNEMLHSHDFSFLKTRSLIHLPAKDNNASISKGSYIVDIFKFTLCSI